MRVIFATECMYICASNLDIHVHIMHVYIVVLCVYTYMLSIVYMDNVAGFDFHLFMATVHG